MSVGSAPHGEMQVPFLGDTGEAHHLHGLFEPSKLVSLILPLQGVTATLIKQTKGSLLYHVSI